VSVADGKDASKRADVAIPILPSRNLENTVEFYRRLGFDGFVHSHGGYAILIRGTLELHFFLYRQVVPEKSASCCYLRVSSVEEVYADFSRARLPRAGIPRQDALEDKPWGMREFAVVDPDGNLVRVGQVLGS
jgi:catechol 2,3-dioxygenase-like lactoylglutathione lyase family enzyme